MKKNLISKLVPQRHLAYKKRKTQSLDIEHMITGSTCVCAFVLACLFAPACTKKFSFRWFFVFGLVYIALTIISTNVSKIGTKGL